MLRICKSPSIIKIERNCLLVKIASVLPRKLECQENELLPNKYSKERSQKGGTMSMS